MNLKKFLKQFLSHFCENQNFLEKFGHVILSGNASQKPEGA